MMGSIKTSFRNAAVALLLAGMCVTLYSAVPGVGIHSWAGWRVGQVTREDCPELRGVPIIMKWYFLEPKPGEYRFDSEFGDLLRAAYEDDLYVTAMIWVGPDCPEWLYDKGVPKVYSDREANALGKKVSKSENAFPYYFSPVYKEAFFGLIDAFGEYVRGLPPELRERIVFVQSAEGSTGDGQPYKGKPSEKQYAISKGDWNDFRNETWIRYMKQFPGLPILVNSDANEGEESEWMLDNMEVIALKQGMFSHGYHVSDNQARLHEYRTIIAQAAARGKSTLTRGEMDGELFVMGWSNRNIPQALYWSGLFATHCELDIWNIPHQALKDEANFPAFAFFNKYAGQRDPSTAPAAYCALRDGLDASDFDRFPASDFGGKPGRKRDPERYQKIANQYAAYGARMDDLEKALRGGMVNRKRSGSNDVGWGILPGNYSRFLSQVEPGSGDVGWWNIDDTIYGRFGRGFEHASGKQQMRFKLDDAFSAEKVEVSVTYLDKGTGEWSFGVSGAEGKALVKNEDSGEWKVFKTTVSGAVLKDAELRLNYEGGEDTIFHLVEVESI